MPGHAMTNAWSLDDQILVQKLVNVLSVFNEINKMPTKSIRMM
jgi:hypothetical protein